MATPPVLFVHGAFSRGSHFEVWERRFARAGFECHAPTLPGHGPADQDALFGLTLADYVRSLEGVRAAMASPPILVGHSMGGLIAQQLAATGPCVALVCLASAPPGRLPAQLRALPHLATLLPAILTGQPVHPPESVFRALALHDLPEEEQDAVLPTLGGESGLAYRSMILGTFRVDTGRVTCPVLCVSGAEDRIISRRVARSVAARYRADHEVLADRGHWLIGRTGAESVASRVLDWIAHRVVPASMGV